MKYISWNKITKVSLTGLLICGATLCEKAQAEENNNYSGVTENLINTTVDVDPPEFVSLVSDKTEVKSGERVSYTLKAKDNGQLSRATIVLKNDENGKTKALYADSPTSDGTFSFTLEVDEKLSSGMWRINDIILRDNSDNYLDIYGNDALALYSTPLKVVNNARVDVDPPEFISLTSDKTKVKSGERVNYTLKAKDNGQLSRATIVLKNDENGKTKALYADSPTSDGTFSFTLEVDEKLSSGIWRINDIILRDDSDNYLDIYGEDALALYGKPLKVGESSLNNVSNNLQPDTEAPKLISIKLNQTSATEHDVVTYTVEASDNRQLDLAYLTIRPVSSPSKYEILTGKLNKEGQLIFRYQVDENSFLGDWEISRLAIYDKAKNFSEYNSENLPKESSPILRVANRREISSLDSINSEKESTLSIHGINNVEKSKNDANILPTDSLSNNQPIDENINTAQSPDKTDSENSTAAQSPDKTSNENINTVQSPDKTDSENSTSVQSPDKTDSENSTTVQSPDKTDSENSTTVQSPDKTSNENINTVQSPDKTSNENSTSDQSPDKNNSESKNMELYVQDALQNNGFSPYGEGNLFENANSDMIEKNNELKIHQYPKRIERNLPKTGNKLFSVLSILGAINLLLILLRILMKTL